MARRHTPPAVPEGDFVRFNHALAHILALPPDTSPARLMQDGLRGLRSFVPFDAGWWGENSGGLEGLAPRNWLSGRINLGAQFAREWNRISSTDGFARGSMEQLDRVVTMCGYEDPVPEVEAFARRHDLHQAMAVTRSMPGSGLLHFVAIYRHRGAAPFQPAQALLFEHFTGHLMQQWRERVAALLGQAGAPGGDAHALVDAQGEFLYIGARLALALRERHPHWSGGQLPAPWQAAWARRDSVLKLGHRRVLRQRCGELDLLSLVAERRQPLLAPREMGVALMFAEGHSHKAIAQATGLSPHTVRTYLREAYLRLGVSNRVALGRALGDTLPPHLRRGDGAGAR